MQGDRRTGMACGIRADSACLYGEREEDLLQEYADGSGRGLRGAVGDAFSEEDAFSHQSGVGIRSSSEIGKKRAS